MPMLEKSKIISNQLAKSSNRSIFFAQKNAHLFLSDGVKFVGQVPAWQNGSFGGDVVFNTGMTGYVESLTDPSYSNQILVFTYPMIGNYGVDLSSVESNKIQVSGVVVSSASKTYSHKNADHSFLGWLKSQNIPIIMDVDTRAVTKHLRTRGSMMGAISDAKIDTSKLKPVINTPGNFKPKLYNTNHKKTIILVDCGVKENILQSLLKLPCKIKKVPAGYDFTKETYDGVLLSNGPGDPTNYPSTIENVKKALKIGKPIFGICLGSQILGLAAGAKTYKLLFGHRGHNQPCIDDLSEKCYITSQNHSYAIDEKTLPSGWKVSFRNLNDNSVEGIAHKSKPYFSVQFHPEACPGPTDTAWMFEKFYESTLNLRKIPISPGSPPERPIPVSSFGVAMATPPSENRTCSSLVDNPGEDEVLRKSSINT